MTQQPVTSLPTTSQNSWLAFGVRWLIYGLMLTTPLIFTWVNEELFEFPKMMWFYSFVFLAVGLSLADQLVNRTWSWPKTKLDWLIGAFVLSQLLSTIFSIHPRTSWFGYYTRFNGGLLSTLAYVSLYYLIVKYFNPKQLVKLTQTIILAAGLAALYALPEHFGVSPSCILITKNVGVSCWVQDVQSRIFGTFGQPNWLAAYLITVLPLTTAWLITTKNFWQKFSLIAVWAVFLADVLFTKSRSGILGLVLSTGVGLILLAWYWLWQRPFPLGQVIKKLNRSLAWTLAMIFLVATGLISLFGTPFTPTIFRLFNSNPVTNNPVVVQTANSLDTGGTESGEIRKIVWSGAVAVWQRYPILGSGLETFAYSYYQDRPLSHNFVSEWDFLYNKAHNELLNYLATAGLLGLLTYLGLWAGVSWAILTWLKSSQIVSAPLNQKLFAIAWLVGLAGQFVSNFFGFSTVMVNLLFWVGMASIAKWTAESSKTGKSSLIEHRSTTIKTSTWLWLGLIIISTWWAASRPIVWWQADKNYALSKALFTSNTYQTGLISLEKAITLSPREALFWDELANQYSRLVVGLQASPNASQSNQLIDQLAQAAITASDQTLALNPRHLDFYKTRARVFINLSQVDAKYLAAATSSLTTAQALAPTDPKLVYHLGLVEISANSTPSALKNLEKAVSLKPDYLSAWFDLGKAYMLAGQPTKAKEIYEHILTKLSPANPEVMAELAALEASSQKLKPN